MCILIHTTGHEFQAVFLCTADYKKASGFISNPTKSLLTPGIFNTVLSRSRSLVVAVGNPFMLLDLEERMQHGGKKCWREYLRLCLTDGTITFSEEILNSESVMEKLARRVGIELPPRKSSSDSSISYERKVVKKSLSEASASSKKEQSHYKSAVTVYRKVPHHSAGTHGVSASSKSFYKKY